jgi:hypothetical protein
MLFFRLNSELLGKSLNALGTQRFANKRSAFLNPNPLEVGLEFAAGRFHRKATIVAKLRRFATGFTLCHWGSLFL